MSGVKSLMKVLQYLNQLQFDEATPVKFSRSARKKVTSNVQLFHLSYVFFHRYHPKKANSIAEFS